MHSGHFEARSLSSEWRGMELLARMCQHARLTNAEAGALLLYCRGCGFTWQAALLGLPTRQAAYENWRRAVDKMTDVFLPLIRRRQIEYSDLHRETWEQAILQCFRNARRHPDHAPQAVRDFWGRWWEGGRDPLLGAEDLHEAHSAEVFLRWLEAWLLVLEEQERDYGVTAERGRVAA